MTHTRKSTVASIASRNVLDSRRLFYFFHVARLGSLTTAEAVLDIAQSAISRQIQQLEADVGQKLLQRTGRGVNLTEAGALLYEQAEVILQEMASTIELVDQVQRHPVGGQVIIASPPTFSSIYMPEVVRRFVDSFPNARLIAYEASSGQVYDYLAAGKVDLAVVLHAPNSQKLAMQKLVTEPMLLMVSASHAVAKRKSIDRKDLTRLDLILPVAAHGARALVEKYCKEGGIQLDPKLRFDSLGMMKAVLQQGRFCAILPRLACANELASGEFVGLPLVPALKRSVYLASLRDRPPTPYMKAITLEIAAVVRSKIGKSQGS